ncbi:Arc family DNA-binding protein [Lonsdalea quercina]|uniref:Arc family DNA-binding protein n=1 Tax=Lonsdalea quercina TaxID=71657 RepID=UPI00047DCEA8|nr:Arc family DNA-binding protein [Lonsdalea quercina]
MSERKYRHPQVNLRLPEDIKEKVVKLAEANGRSANAEMVLAIEAWVNSMGEPPKPLLDEIRDRLEKLESQVKNK